MKSFKITQLLLIFLFSSILGNAQTTKTPEKIIRLDFKQMEFVNDNTIQKASGLKKGEIYRLEIDNINLNLFNVTIGKTDSTLKSDVKFPTFELIGLDAINSVVSSIIPKASTPVISKIIDEEANLVSLKNKYHNINENIQKTNLSIHVTTLKLKEKIDDKSNLIESKFLSDSTALANSLSSLKSDSTYFTSMLITALKEQKETKEGIAKLEAELLKLKEKDRVLTEIERYRIRTSGMLQDAKNPIRNADSMLFELNLQALSYKEGLDSYVSQPVIEDSKVWTLARIVMYTDSIRLQIQNIRDSADVAESAYRTFKGNIPTANKTYEDEQIKKSEAEMLGILSKAKEALDKALEKLSRSKISEYLESLIHLKNNSDRTYKSLPMQHNGDISNLTITIAPKKPEYGQTRTATYQFPKDKFYAGIGGSFYYAHFKNQTYGIRENQNQDTTSQFEIIDEGEMKGEIGVAVLLHVGCKISESDFGWHGTVGPALSLTNKPQPRIAGGTGISYGKRGGMVTLDALIMGGYTERKSKTWENITTVNEKPDKITQSRLSATWAISLGYIYKF